MAKKVYIVTEIFEGNEDAPFEVNILKVFDNWPSASDYMAYKEDAELKRVKEEWGHECKGDDWKEFKKMWSAEYSINIKELG